MQPEVGGSYVRRTRPLVEKRLPTTCRQRSLRPGSFCAQLCRKYSVPASRQSHTNYFRSVSEILTALLEVGTQLLQSQTVNNTCIIIVTFHCKIIIWWKGKVLSYSLPSVGPGADPGVQAVSSQMTFESSFQPKNVTIFRPAPISIAWWQGHIGVNNFPKVVT